MIEEHLKQKGHRRLPTEERERQQVTVYPIRMKPNRNLKSNFAERGWEQLSWQKLKIKRGGLRNGMKLGV